MEDVPPPQYVSPDMVGYEDLNANGDWRDTPDGPIWTPRVAAGWTPYHDGHWAWIGPRGWTWVDRGCNAPLLRSSSGRIRRWQRIQRRHLDRRGGGLVGWFPLGPKEPYYPSYQVSPAYIRQVNVTNTRITNINVTNVNVTNITYVNRSAVVAVPQNSFVSAQPVQRAAVQVNAEQMRQAQVIGAAPKVAPQPQSLVANSGGRRAARS
jgi:hypothetical protein